MTPAAVRCTLHVAAMHRCYFRGYRTSSGVALHAHLADNDLCIDRTYDGRTLREIEEELRRDGLVSPELPNALLLWDGSDFPWKLRSATPNDGPQRGMGGSTYRDYVPPGCAFDVL